MSLTARLTGVLLLVVVAGCAPQRSVRVEPVEGPRPRSLPAGGLYEVTRGDTLYGIAFRHGLDYRELAAANGIAAPFTIYPGQKLRLRGAPVRRADPPRPTASTGAPVVAPIVQSPPPGSAATTPPASTPPAASQQPAVPVAAAPPPQAPAAPVLPAGSPRWQWPTGGAIISRFLAGDPTRQGVSLAGSGGDPVRAAADGVVVYSGSGLIGYGELIIVKHNDTWLSAYGHNRKRLVAEGAQVKGGQTIAELGRTGASRDMLHFEVRRNGRPVDPLTVMPKR